MREEVLALLIREDGAVLLGRKQVRFGAGRLNAPGGGVEEDEDGPTATIRETAAESGLMPEELELAADLTFQFVDKADATHHVRAYRIRRWQGQLHDSDEMADWGWFSPAEMPWDEMWPADKLWLPHVLLGGMVRGTVVYGSNGQVSSSSLAFEAIGNSPRPG